MRLHEIKIFDTAPTPALMGWMLAGLGEAVRRFPIEVIRRFFTPSDSVVDETDWSVATCWSEEFEMGDYNYEVTGQVFEAVYGEEVPKIDPIRVKKEAPYDSFSLPRAGTCAHCGLAMKAKSTAISLAGLGIHHQTCIKFY